MYRAYRSNHPVKNPTFLGKQMIFRVILTKESNGPLLRGWGIHCMKARAGIN